MEQMDVANEPLKPHLRNISSISNLSFVTLLSGMITLFVDAVIVFMVVWVLIRGYWLNTTNRLIRKIYQDSIIYFFINLLFAAMAIALYMNSVGLAAMALQFGGVMRSILASRMILELKEYGNYGQGSDTSYPGSRLSTLHFGFDGLEHSDEQIIN
ncbi:hypothetical protein P691DRAFT_433923 [Macrolepiota fuliginosa MF-IS2]|uniref:Uncharacterized protein n=1 Tax=Macrolepiota fuliginosa MF-IS2 TaxID=1400762 RepID=A0A9P5X586_9AGAR|nr:hypothetical protein P691DRAFT_433923 [Macrolepiota fuliginosa MF-IS2]